MVHEGKRERLIQAATRLFHRQGFGSTSLADIAAEAGVPLGNVYYYFKSREALLKSVMESRREATAKRREEWKSLPAPLHRLLALLETFLATAEESTAYGCPVGGLCAEVARMGGAIAEEPAALLQDAVQWATLQFREMGFPEAQAERHATHLISSRQGSILLSHAFRNPKHIQQETARLKQWLVELEVPKQRRKG